MIAGRVARRYLASSHRRISDTILTVEQAQKALQVVGPGQGFRVRTLNAYNCPGETGKRRMRMRT
jgi:hypothetical protein